MYSDWNTRKKILDGELEYEPDSHTSIAELHGYKGKDEDMLNKYEYNPLTGEFTIDQINNKDDSDMVEAAVRALDFGTIVPQLIIKPIIHPFRDVPPPETITNAHKELLRQWDSVWDSVWASVRDRVEASVRDRVGDSMWAYISSFFSLEEWRHAKHNPGENPFQPGIDLWETGLVPSFDGEKWRLHGGPDGRILYEE